MSEFDLFSFDDLGNNLGVYQRPEGYRFTSDAVLLANFVSAGSKEKVVELCAGSGVISILVASKTKAKEIVAIEIQPSLADMARESVKRNNLEDKIKVITADVKDGEKVLPSGFGDVCCCNPPYFRMGEGVVSDNEEIAIARHEIKINLEEVVLASSYFLKYGGRAYFVYRADRLYELFLAMDKARLTPKKLVLISPKEGKPADTVLVEGRKMGSPGMKILSLIRSDEILEQLKNI